MGSDIYSKYPPGTVFRGRTLNLGCGYQTYDSAVNIDLYGKPDIRWDLNVVPLPFEDESFDFIIANHILEHIDNWWELFNDLARILKPNGRLEVWVPGNGADSIRGYRDHLHEINQCSFYGTFGIYRAGGNAWAMGELKRPAGRLRMSFPSYVMENKWWLRGPRAWKQWCVDHLRNVVSEKGWIFTKVTEEEYAAEWKKRLRELDPFIQMFGLREAYPTIGDPDTLSAVRRDASKIRATDADEPLAVSK